MIRSVIRTSAAASAVMVITVFGSLVHAQQKPARQSQIQIQTTNEGKRLHEFFAEEWERGLRENPESA